MFYVDNAQGESCMLRGYPGVELVGPDGPTYSLPRQSGDPRALTLAPGASASSRLTFLPAANGWVPRTIVVTLLGTGPTLDRGLEL